MKKKKQKWYPIEGDCEGGGMTCKNVVQVNIFSVQVMHYQSIHSLPKALTQKKGSKYTKMDESFSFCSFFSLTSFFGVSLHLKSSIAPVSLSYIEHCILQMAKTEKRRHHTIPYVAVKMLNCMCMY